MMEHKGLAPVVKASGWGTEINSSVIKAKMENFLPWVLSKFHVFPNDKRQRFLLNSVPFGNRDRIPGISCSLHAKADCMETRR